jgi:hypothetical protein
MRNDVIHDRCRYEPSPSLALGKSFERAIGIDIGSVRRAALFSSDWDMKYQSCCKH